MSVSWLIRRAEQLPPRGRAFAAWSTMSRSLSRSSTARKILSAALTVGGISLIPRIVGTGRELVVAGRFGRGEAVDTFVIALSLPLFLASVVCASLAPAFIPRFIHVRETEGPDAAHRLLGTVTICSQIMLLVLSVLVAVLAPYYLPLIAHGFSPDKLALACKLTRMVSPYVFLFGMGAIWTAVLNAKERFSFAATVPVATPIVVIALLFLRPEWGITSMAVGTVLGAFIEAGLLAVALSRQGVSLIPYWGGIDQHVRSVAGQYLPMMAGSSLAATSLLVDQAMAARLASGSVAALGYASKIIMVLTALGASSLSISTLPYFSQMVARREWHEIRLTLQTFNRIILLTTVPVTAGLVFLSKPLVQMLYQRGHFSIEDSAIVASVQAMLALQLPFYTMGLVGSRLICALGKNQFLMLVSVSNVMLNVVLNIAFMRMWGISGIALSTSVVHAVAWLLIYVAIYHALRGQEQTLLPLNHSPAVSCSPATPDA